MDQILLTNPAVWAFIKARPIDRRRLIVDLAVRLDQRTAAPRAGGDDAFVCRAGLEETSFDLEHGSQHEVPTQPGHVGRTIMLDDNGKYRPRILPDSVSAPKAAAERAALPKTLATLLGLPG